MTVPVGTTNKVSSGRDRRPSVLLVHQLSVVFSVNSWRSQSAHSDSTLGADTIESVSLAMGNVLLSRLYPLLSGASSR